jgi:hypothetical protein
MMTLIYIQYRKAYLLSLPHTPTPSNIPKSFCQQPTPHSIALDPSSNALHILCCRRKHVVALEVIIIS